MTIYVYGMNHGSASLELRERVAFPEAGLQDAVGRLVRAAEVREGVIVSTCNRTEVLVHAPAAGAAEALRRFLSDERGVSAEDLERHCYLHADHQAVRHMFRVASSLDSMVLGEAQILGQVKEAYAAAQRAKTLGTVLDGLMQRAFSVAKKVRTETGIARYPVSMAHAAVGLARDIFGPLVDRRVLILGAGKMARLAARQLVDEGVRSIVVANRSFQNGSDLARELGGSAVPMDRMPEEMEAADIVIASTAAPHPIVRHDEVLRISRRRRGRPLFLIDIAVPRDVDPRINEIDNVYLYDLDDLQGVVRSNQDERRHEAALAESIVDREARAYMAWLSSLEIAPTIVDLRRRLHAIGEEELRRFRSRLGGLSPDQEKALGEMTEGLVNKLLHHPIQALKRAAANGGGERLSFLREIFGLERGGRPEPGEAGPVTQAAPESKDDPGREQKEDEPSRRPTGGS
jgi:glutamyl-tRNA reductase